MKKLIYILFLSAYLFLTVGINISSHFCGGQLVSVRIVTTATAKEPMDCCGEECADSCCQNKFTTIKLEDFQKVEAAKVLDNLTADILPRLTFETEKPVSDFIGEPNLIAHSPPGIPTYIYNCTFLI